MPVSSIFNYLLREFGFFFESSAGKFSEILQGNMRFSAAHKMPPAKTCSSQHVKKLNPIFWKYSVYAGFMYFVQPT